MSVLGLVGTTQKAVPQLQRKTAFKVYSTANVTPQVGGTIVPFNNVTYDLGANFDLFNERYTIPYQGLYQYAFYFVIQFTAGGASQGASIELISQAGVEFLVWNNTFKNHVNLDVHSASGVGSHIFEKGDQIRLRAFGGNNFVFVGAEVSYYWTMYRVEAESRTVL